MSNVIPFERAFIATDLTVDEVRERVREKGWPGCHIDIDEFKKTGVMVVKRLTRKEAFNE